MPKPKHNIKEFHWLALKEQIQSTYGQNISTSSDVSRLCADILIKTGVSLSSSTLYRLILSATNKNIPYQNTLDILADYCGHGNWNTFCKQHDQRTNINTEQDILPDAMGLRLLQICLQNHDFKSVIDYTKLLPEPWVIDYPLQVKISETYGVAMRHDAQVRKVMLKELALIPQGRHFFYETFVDLDHLNGYYGDALDQYENYTTKLSQRKTLNDLLFIKCLRFWRAHQSRDLRKVKQLGHQLFNTYHPGEIHPDNEVHFYPVARWRAYRLIYWHYTDQLTQDKIENTILNIEEMMNMSQPHEVRVYMSKLFEALLIVGHHSYVYPLFLKYQGKVLAEHNESECYTSFYAFAKRALLKKSKHEIARQIIIPEANFDLMRCKQAYGSFK